jgi:imidazolonepropionase-like amidohydrolase
MLTFSEPELRAGVEAAADRNTYVAVHAYPSAAIERAIAAGVEKGVWLSIQPFVGDDDTVPLSGQSRVNQLQVIAGTNTAYPLAKAYKLKTAFGSDLLFSAQKATRQGIMLTHLTRWYESAEILKMATGTNGELLALSGPRNPYPGKLGIIEEGAFADLIVVDGDPITNIALIENPEKNFLIIMKDGKIYKDSLHS